MANTSLLTCCQTSFSNYIYIYLKDACVLKHGFRTKLQFQAEHDYVTFMFTLLKINYELLQTILQVL